MHNFQGHSQPFCGPKYASFSALPWLALIPLIYYTTLKTGIGKWTASKCTGLFVRSIHNFYNSFKFVQIRHPSLETALECYKVFLLKLEEQRQPHTRNSPTLTLSAVSSAML